METINIRCKNYEDFTNFSKTMDRNNYKLPEETSNIIYDIKKKLNIKSYYDNKSKINITTIQKNQEEELNELYKILNKITTKTYDKLSVEVINIIKQLPTDNIEYQNLICEKIFSIISNNSFFCELYAKLYSNIIDLNNHFKNILYQKINNYVESINNIIYVSSNEDYDKYCNYIKQIDTIKNFTNFIVQCFNNNICEIDTIINLIITFQTNTINNLESVDKIYENESYINNIYLILKELSGLFIFHEQWEIIKRNNLYIHEFKGDGKTNKIKFKIMDINDLISKAEN